MEYPLYNPVWLRSFVAVAGSMSFTRAAATLETRQSTVSEHVRKLEEASSVRLFVRDTHSVRLTAEGEAMLGFATSILAVNERAHRHFRGDYLAGTIRLGVPEDVVLAGLPRLLRQFTADHPRVKLELVVEVSEKLRERFDEGNLDLAILKRQSGGSYGELLWSDALVWISARDFRLSPGLPVPLITLAPPAITRAVALEAFEHAGIGWQFVCTSGSQSGVHAAVAAGLGVAPHARSLVPSGLTIIRDGSLPTLPSTEFALMTSRTAARDPGRSLGAAIRSNVHQLRGTAQD